MTIFKKWLGILAGLLIASSVLAQPISKPPTNVTVDPEGGSAIDVQPWLSFVYQYSGYTAAGSTKYVVKLPGHSCDAGDLFTFTDDNTSQFQERTIKAATSSDITLDRALKYVPSASNYAYCYRRSFLTSDVNTWPGAMLVWDQAVDGGVQNILTHMSDGSLLSAVYGYSTVPANPTINGVNQVPSLNIYQGSRYTTVNITGTWTGTIVAQEIIGVANYVTIPVRNRLTGEISTSITANGTYTFLFNYGCRLTSTAWTSGTATLKLVHNSWPQGMIIQDSLPSGSNNIGSVSLSGATGSTANIISSGEVTAATIDGAGAGGSTLISAGGNTIQSLIFESKLTSIVQISIDGGATWLDYYADDFSPALEFGDKFRNITSDVKVRKKGATTVTGTGIIAWGIK